MGPGSAPDATKIAETGADFLLPENPDLGCSGGAGPKVICGQALAAVADTAKRAAIATGTFAYLED